MKTLEQEFAEYKEHHIYEIIVTGLITLEEEGIYNHRLLEKYKDCKMADRKEKAYHVADDLYSKYVKKNDDRYLNVYEMIWNEIGNSIREDEAIRLGVNYDQ